MEGAFRKTKAQKQATKILTSKASHIFLYGGSRSGKTFLLVRAIFIRALKAAGSRHLIIRLRFGHAKTSLWYDTFEKVQKLCFPDVPIRQNRTDWFLQFSNGSQIWVGGLDDKERTEKILGHEYCTIYFNEISQMSYDSITMALPRCSQKVEGIRNKNYYDCNPPEMTHWSYKLFFQGTDPESNLKVTAGLYEKFKMNPVDNQENLPDDYIENILEKLPPRQRKRFLLGEYTTELKGVLWNMMLIDKNRVSEYPNLRRIVVAIDPAGTAKKTSDETGIIVAGVDNEGEGYVVDDISGRYTPNQWGRMALQMFYKWGADRIIGEVNYGGDLIESNLRTIDKNIPYKSVTATRRKTIRAEPVVALYEQGKIHHVGLLPGLEDQMTTWRAQDGHISPDRVDALVWAFTELMLVEQKEAFFI